MMEQYNPSNAEAEILRDTDEGQELMGVLFELTYLTLDQVHRVPVLVEEANKIVDTINEKYGVKLKKVEYQLNVEVEQP